MLLSIINSIKSKLGPLIEKAAQLTVSLRLRFCRSRSEQTSEEPPVSSQQNAVPESQALPDGNATDPAKDEVSEEVTLGRKARLVARLTSLKHLPKKYVIVALVLVVAGIGGALPFAIKNSIKHLPNPELVQLEQIKKANQALLVENQKIKAEVVKYKGLLAKASPPVAVTATPKPAPAPKPPTPQISVILPKDTTSPPPEDCAIGNKTQIREVLKRCIDAYNAAVNKTVANLPAQSGQRDLGG